MDDFGGGRILEYVSACAGAHGLRHIFDVVVHREHQYAHGREPLVKNPGQHDPVHAVHPHVHQREIWTKRFGERERFLRVAGLARDLEARHGFEPQAQAVANERVIVDEDDLG